DLFYCKEINELKIIRYDINIDLICKILFESLFLHGDEFYSILYLKNINNFFSTRLFKKLSIISECPEEPFKEFKFLVNNTEQLYFGRNYPEGSLKNIFFKANLNKLKILSIHDFHIGKKDTNTFKNLDFLISLNILGCNFLDITLAGLFSDEKEYMIENLILRGAYLEQKDIYFLSKLRMLKSLTLSACEYENEAHTYLKIIYFKRLNFIFIDCFLSDAPRNIIDYFIEEFSPNILSLKVEKSME
ncbi:hypothetical protein CWI38_1143p0030, partial [Hamiltosporidium tvaerminnensis]